ncbi:hypothetical protein [Niastella populi]|uniref:Uncharacterized protein n=1 Tax=Niastella populi TaxID=550983 RepID=A0A1V9G6Q4_9BACT|nr:hypothetical protein [Niastella populi]OQP66224.1 hypothetical protein A4R26_14145 [Niastella populi]
MKKTFPFLTLFVIISFSGQAQFSLKKVLKAGEKAVRNVGRTVEKGIKDVTKTSGVAIHDLGKATGKAADDARKAIEKGLTDASRESGRAGKNIVKETGRVGTNAVDIFKALEKYAETNINGTINIAKSTEQRIREGKLLDAVFHVALDPLTNQEEAAFLATQQSKYLNTAAATAAGVYGGPGGSAAYAAWQTYRASGGNAELAFRAGIITGLTSSALKVVGSMSGSEAKEMLQKAVLAGAVGGLAIAASGGNEDQIKKGFVLGGGMVLVQDLYRNYTQQTLDPSPSTKEPYCTSPGDPSCATLKAAFYKDKNGNLVFDPSKLDPKASYVGVGADPNAPLKLGADIPWDSDQSVLMRSAAQVPGMNAMGLFHDKLVVSWAISDNIGNQLTIFPAMLFTYIGTDGGLTTKIASVTAEQKAQQPPNITKQAANPTSQSPATQQVQSPNNDSKFVDNQGNEFHRINNVIYNRWGQKIDFDKLPLEIRTQLTNLPSATPQAELMFDFSSPGTKLANVPENIPCGFNGSPDKFVPLPSIEYAAKYIENKNWEDYGMKNMLTSKHITAPIGSIIYVRNIANGALVRTYVIGSLSKNELNSGATIILSDPVLKQLGAEGERLWVETDYEDIAVEKLIFKQGAGEKLAFNNLRNGKWQLRIFDDFKTLHTFKDYNNQYSINLPTGRYGFELVDIAPLQTYRAYTGTFTVNP